MRCITLGCRWLLLPVLFISCLVAASGAVPVQVDSICRPCCQILTVQDGRVRFIDQWLTRNLDLGPYATAAQRLVPRTEAPVCDLRSKRGWRVVASVYLDHGQDEILAHVRFFGPDGRLRATSDALPWLEQTEIGNLFGDSNEIFAVTSNWEHTYNVQSEIWLLPKREGPKCLLSILGVFGDFSARLAGKPPGVVIARQTYDGVHAETKGIVREFYAWNGQAKSLIAPAKQ